jgi:hypothetical protein
MGIPVKGIDLEESPSISRESGFSRVETHGGCSNERRGERRTSPANNGIKIIASGAQRDFKNNSRRFERRLTPVEPH